MSLIFLNLPLSGLHSLPVHPVLWLHSCLHQALLQPGACDSVYFIYFIFSSAGNKVFIWKQWQSVSAAGEKSAHSGNERLERKILYYLFVPQSKGGILSKACDYIRELRQNNQRLQDSYKEVERVEMDNELLRQQVNFPSLCTHLIFWFATLCKHRWRGPWVLTDKAVQCQE